MNGRGANIQSLFIDEGFGTLDESTLDKALAALEQLQSDGRQVVLISHVGALQTRFPNGAEVRVVAPARSALEMW